MLDGNLESPTANLGQKFEGDGYLEFEFSDIAIGNGAVLILTAYPTELEADTTYYLVETEAVNNKIF